MAAMFAAQRRDQQHRALYSLQNIIMLTPAAPRAGPTGGAGFALPASSASLIILVTFLAIISGSVARLHTAGCSPRCAAHAPRPPASAAGGEKQEARAERLKRTSRRSIGLKTDRR